jgi:hypothetical protein
VRAKTARAPSARSAAAAASPALSLMSPSATQAPSAARRRAGEADAVRGAGDDCDFAG